MTTQQTASDGYERFQLDTYGNILTPGSESTPVLEEIENCYAELDRIVAWNEAMAEGQYIDQHF